MAEMIIEALEPKTSRWLGGLSSADHAVLRAAIFKETLRGRAESTYVARADFGGKSTLVHFDPSIRGGSRVAVILAIDEVSL